MDYPARIKKCHAAIAAQGLDALLVTSDINVRYLTGFTGDSTFLLLHRNGECLLSDRRYETQLQQQCAGTPALVRGPERNMFHLVEESVQELSLNGRRVGLEAEHVAWSMQSTFAELKVDLNWVQTTGLVENLRCIKDQEEIAILRRAVWIAEQSFLALRARLRPGWTELQMAHEIEATMRQLGASDCGFAPILAVDANAALPHAHPGQQVLDEAAVLLVDWGAKYQGYTSDLTRTLSIGAPTADFCRIYEVVREAQAAAINRIEPGVALKDVDAAARDVICQAGFGDHFGHGLGHGIGLEIHESPRMASISKGDLKAGMVITVEPGIYLPGRFGVRIEDDILVTPTGHEVLSVLPKGLEDGAVFL